MNGEDLYLLTAIDAVMRKSIAAKQRQANLQHMARLRKIGLTAFVRRPNIVARYYRHQCCDNSGYPDSAPNKN